jgi:ATP-dependent DNA helicase RecQ
VLSGEREVTVFLPGSPGAGRPEGPASPPHAAGRRHGSTPGVAATSTAPPADLDPDGQLRFARLRRWRLELARAEARAAFTIFDDRTLREIADRDPASMAELLQLRGVGPTKASRYGEAVIGVLGDG